jgi:hypothetical protein
MPWRVNTVSALIRHYGWEFECTFQCSLYIVLTLEFVALIGVATAVLAATIGMFKNDIKKYWLTQRLVN